nr:hypothetical protein BaRGS_012352 [Batillaria attramentaria]
MDPVPHPAGVMSATDSAVLAGRIIPASLDTDTGTGPDTAEISSQPGLSTDTSPTCSPQNSDTRDGDSIKVRITPRNNVASNDGGGAKAEDTCQRDVTLQDPASLMMQQSVLPDTTTLLVGDSILKYIKEEMISTGPQDKVQVVSVSGLRTNHLADWLARQPQASGVSLVTFHTGVNDCKEGRDVTTQLWKDLLKHGRRVFPNAHVQASSIIPAKGRHTMNSLISLSNSNLRHVCVTTGVTYIDNSTVFTAPSGAPRLALYTKTDRIHPSMQGVISLALHIKRGVFSSPIRC